MFLIKAHYGFATPIESEAMAALCKLEINDQPFSLYLLTQQNGDSLELHAFDGTESWAAKLTSGKLAEMAGKVCNCFVKHSA